MKIQHLLPKHIRSLIQDNTTQQANHSANIKVDFSQMHTNIGTIGTDKDYSAYPQQSYNELTQLLAETHKVSQAQITLGNGLEGLVDTCFRTFCTPSIDTVLHAGTPKPTIKKALLRNAVEWKNVNSPSAKDWLTAVDLSTKIIFLSNPHHIQGQCLKAYELIELMEQFDGIVIIDEAWIDYNERESLLSLVNNYTRLIVLQSFSAAWGMAGLRLGIAYSSVEVAEVLQKVQADNVVNSQAIRVAKQALYVPTQKQRAVEKNLRALDLLIKELNDLKIIQKLHISEANFVLIQVANAPKLQQQLLEEGLYTLCIDEQHLRISSGTLEQNDFLINQLKKVQSRESSTQTIVRAIGRTLKKASMFLGVFKKFMS